MTDIHEYFQVFSTGATQPKAFTLVEANDTHHANDIASDEDYVGEWFQLIADVDKPMSIDPQETKPLTEAEYFRLQNLHTVQMTNRQISMVLAGLRMLQDSEEIDRGKYEDILHDVGEIDPDEIDLLCEAINA